MEKKGSNQQKQDIAKGEVGISRRSFLGAGGALMAGAGLTAQTASGFRSGKNSNGSVGKDLVNAEITQLQDWMASGELSATQITQWYLNRISRIDHFGDMGAVLATNPDALAIAAALDGERASSGPRGPLHGIPILLKDNIDTGDAMQTTAGSLALAGAPAQEDSTVAARLRAAGAIVLGKTNLSEWANFRGFASTSGWSGVGGQCRNPYVLDRNPCGSSSGSAAAVSSSLAAAALATETDGSIVCPASACGVVGIKPTVGLTSRAGVVPISATQDTVGVHGRTVADAAAVLGALTGVDSRDPATANSSNHAGSDYTQFLDVDGLRGARIGVARQMESPNAAMAQVFENALATMRAAGAEVVDVEIPSYADFNNDISELVVLVYEFKRDLNQYLASRTGVPISSLAQAIEFNLDHAEAELQYFGQEWMELAEIGIFSQQEYEQALITGPTLAGAQGIDATLATYNLDAIVAPTNSPAWPNDLVNGDCFQFGSSGFAAVAGYPLITVPMGQTLGLPLGMTLMAGAWSEPTLIRLASGFEAARQARISPQFKKSILTHRPLGFFKQQPQTRAGKDRAALRASLLQRFYRLPRPWYL